MTRTFPFAWLILCLAMLGSCKKKDTPWLSSLNAGKDFPLYTTYAAAQQRSDYLLDQGYEFIYDKEKLGADFITDNGGDIGLGFRYNGKWVYTISDMYSPPVITSSFPDLVSYTFHPFEGIKVSAVFFTYSSRSAILELDILNSSETPTELEVFPFMRSNQRRYHSVKINKPGNWLAFSHEEYPDGWTLAHDLPYTDSIRNFLLLSIPAEGINAFNSETGESPEIASEIRLKENPVRQLNGRLFSISGERITGSTKNRLQLKVDGREDVLLTEKSIV
jgi:hypothetical protein